VIITRSPLRITLGGGGTDLPSYYEQFGGFLIAGAIDNVGAGAGGLLMFYAEDKPRLRHAMLEAGLREVRFRFDFEGTKVVIQ
jgi:galactokinase/mevalonate kinase-like predicted kinase